MNFEILMSPNVPQGSLNGSAGVFGESLNESHQSPEVVQINLKASYNIIMQSEHLKEVYQRLNKSSLKQSEWGLADLERVLTSLNESE